MQRVFYQFDAALANKKTAICLELNYKEAKQSEISNIGKLENLEVLILTDYPASYHFPKRIYDLVNLKSIVFKRCSFNIIPDGIQGLVNLDEINFIECSFRKISEDVLNISSLKKLNIDNTDLVNLTDADFSASQVEEFIFCGASIEQFYKVFKKFRNLKSVVLKSNNLESVPKLLLTYKKLQSISIVDNCLDHIPLVISELKNLKNIDLSFNRIERIDPGFAMLKKLKFMNLSNNRIKEFPQQILEISNLESLKIDNNLFDVLPEELFKLKKLTTLDIGTEKKMLLPTVILDWLSSGKSKKLTCHIALSKLLNADFYKSADSELKRELAMLHTEDFRYQSNRKLNRLKELIQIKYFNTNEIAYAKFVDNNDIVYKSGELIFFWDGTIVDSEIKVATKAKGIKIAKELSGNVTKIVVNPDILQSEDLGQLLEGKRELITISGLMDFLTKDNPPYLLSDTGDAVQKIRSLIRTRNKENILLALELLKNGGLPQELYTDILKVYFNSNDKLLANRSLKLLKQYAEPGWDIALKKIIYCMENFDVYTKRYHYILTNINPEFIKVNFEEILSGRSYYA